MVLGTVQALLANCFMLVSCLAYSLTLKMEATCFSEMLDAFEETNGFIYQKRKLFITTAVRTFIHFGSFYKPLYLKV
jgi:hypothetical protein